MSSNNFLICLRWRLFAISRFNSRTARPVLQAEINFSLRQAQPQMLGPLRDWQSPAKFKLAIKSQERQGNWANNSNQCVSPDFSPGNRIACLGASNDSNEQTDDETS